VLLGRWQWDRTQSILAAERAAAAAAIPVQDVFAIGGASAEVPTDVPAAGIGRPVTVTGRYEPAMQVAVTDRERGGQRGVWIVTGLRLADNSVAAVLRGWLPSAAEAGAVPPTGDVTVSGVLQPDETFYADASSAPGTVAAIDHARLADLWQAPVLPGFTVLGSQDPIPPSAPLPVEATVQTADVDFPLQNFFYAFQWWIFGAFAVVVFLRWLWLESRTDES
jgi:cytochrome oxidase assembly protein ShyY1